MSCPVYCLVPHPEQVDPLVDRLREAGVRASDIVVVQRDDEEWRAAPDCGPCHLLHALWRMQLAPAVWWWPLAVGEFAAARRNQPSRSGAGENEVIPLAEYQRKRRDVVAQ